MKISHVMVATDFSAPARRARDAALNLAAAHGAKLTIIHALHDVPMVAGPEAIAIPPTLHEQMRDGAIKALEGEAAEARQRGIEADTRLVEGAPGYVLAAEAERVGGDVLVAGTHGRTGVRHAVLGSVAERLVRSAPCPVISVHEDHGFDGRARKVLVPVDFSASSDRALEWARTLRVGDSPEHVILVHALHVPIELEALLAESGMGVRERLRDDASSRLDQALRELQDAGLSAEYVTQAGPPERVVVELARDRGADLICMGTHGRSGLGHLFMGSVAERVVRSAPCAVLTARA